MARPLPVIGITARRMPVDHPFPLLGAVAIQDTYVDAVERSGALAAVLGARPLDPAAADDVVATLDALVLTGGPDVNPARYGEAPHPSVYGISDVQDDFEVALLNAALAARLPVLAICRGLQLMNVRCGGSLTQHIVEEPGRGPHGTPNGGAPTHNRFQVSPGTTLAALLDGDEPHGDCHHHQAVERVGDGLRVIATTDDGTVEGLELVGYDGWLVAVQWHPEDTAATDPVQQRFFDALTAEARRGAR